MIQGALPSSKVPLGVALRERTEVSSANWSASQRRILPSVNACHSRGPAIEVHYPTSRCAAEACEVPRVGPNSRTRYSDTSGTHRCR